MTERPGPGRRLLPIVGAALTLAAALVRPECDDTRRIAVPRRHRRPSRPGSTRRQTCRRTCRREARLRSRSPLGTRWRHAFVPLEGVFARLHPAKGKASPTTADAVTDWPGHHVIDLTVPAGGPGRLELGVHGPGGDRPLKIAGVGPPADAPLGDLVQTQVQDIVGDVVAGRPFPLAVSLGPRGWWNFDALHLPDRLVVSAAHPGGTGAVLDRAPARRSRRGAVHRSSDDPETGDIELTFLLPGANGQPDTVITASPTPIQVIESGVRLDGTTPRPAASGPTTPAAPAPAAEGGDPSPIVWIGLVGLLVLAGVLVFGGTVRGWLRRDD